MKHKKQILIFSGLALAVALHAQEAVTTAGGSGTAGTVSVSWSVGETVAGTLSSGQYVLTQGVQQPARVEIVNHTPEAPAFRINAYPNPTTDKVRITASEDAAFPLTIRIFNAGGKTVYHAPMSSPQLDITAGSFAPGMYFIRITDKNNKTQSFKLIKQ